MTPTELFALVRELPREVWPDWCEWFNGQWVVGDYQDRQRNRTTISPEHAASLFTAKLVEWFGQDQAFSYRKDKHGRWYVGFEWQEAIGDGPTLLAALIAAYKAATPPGQKPRTATPQR